MLLHSSSKELQYSENATALRRIHQAKLRALSKIKELSHQKVTDVSDKITRIMQVYLEESGEWDHALWSFGLAETQQSRTPIAGSVAPY